MCIPNLCQRPRTWLVMLFILAVAGNLAAQNKRKFKRGEQVQLQDSLTHFSQSDIFTFPNLSRISYYQDVRQFDRIAAALELNEQAELYRLLRTYVKNFGVQNFSRNVSMIWILARLSETYGPPGEAVLLYKLAVKHHQQGVDITRLNSSLNLESLAKRYDSLERDKKKYFVPLDHYYQLVDYRKEIDTLRPPHAVLTLMSRDINSDKEDYGPVMGNIDYLMLFTSKRNRHTVGFTDTFDEDIFFSVKVDGAWTTAEELRAINTHHNEGSACLSLDGKTLIFSRCLQNNCDLFSARLLKDSLWGEVKNMGPKVNSMGWDSHPSLNHRGDTLYFASDRIGSFGQSDIYFCVKDKKGNWTAAQNAGPVINTRASEVSPFFHHQYNVLYFSSNGQPLNFGDFDIYKAYRRNGIWQEPKNIGPLVNGAGSEYYFTIDAQAHDLYYARSEEHDPKNLDLYSFPVPMEAQPLATARLSGKLTDPTGQPEQGIVSVIDLDAGVEVAPRFLREDGSFDFSLINKRNYLLIIQGDDFFRIEEIFFMEGDREVNKVAEPIESKIAFKSLEFENGKANILPAMHADLDKLANFLIDHPDVNLRISGHTDSQGKEDVNRTLSQGRADAIKEYLVTQFAIDGNRIEAIGYGSSKPIVAEVTEEDRQLNRRVEFEIYKP